MVSSKTSQTPSVPSTPAQEGSTAHEGQQIVASYDSLAAARTAMTQLSQAHIPSTALSIASHVGHSPHLDYEAFSSSKALAQGLSVGFFLGGIAGLLVLLMSVSLFPATLAIVGLAATGATLGAVGSIAGYWSKTDNPQSTSAVGTKPIPHYDLWVDAKYFDEAKQQLAPR